MTAVRVLAATARTLSLLVTSPGARFALPRPLDWSLCDDNGTLVANGTTDQVAVFIDGLCPATRYHMTCDLGTVSVQTLPCAGLIDAADFGVDPALADNSDALARAIAAVPAGGTLRLAPGRYFSGPIFLKPQMTLLLDAGAELAAIADRVGWPQLTAHDATGRVMGTWEGLPEATFAALITAVDCTGVTITGRGVIDGGGDRGDWWTWPKETREGARRPRTVHLAYCDQARLTGVTLRNSPSWTLHPYRCAELHVSSVRIENPPDSPNTDGLNPESCTRVTICGVDFSVGDDCIAIKAGKRGTGPDTDQIAHIAPTRDVTISHCRMMRGHGAVVLGSEMSGGIHDVTISDCEFHATDRGLRLKTRRGRGGTMSGVTLTRVDMVNVPTPLAINMFYFCDHDGKSEVVQSRMPAVVDDTTPVIHDITLCDVTARGVTLAAAAILGLPESPVTGVQLFNVQLSYDPAAQADVPLMALGVAPVRHGGILSEFADVAGTITEIPYQKESVAC